jgi:hypothetical protein
MRVRTGTILTMTTTSRGGRPMNATGTMRTTATTTIGITMIMTVITTATAGDRS